MIDMYTLSKPRRSPSDRVAIALSMFTFAMAPPYFSTVHEFSIRYPFASLATTGNTLAATSFRPGVDKADRIAAILDARDIHC